MAKKKLSKDQKRRLKKEKKKKRKQRQYSAGPDKRSGQVAKTRIGKLKVVDPPPLPPEYSFDEQERRINHVLDTAEIPPVDAVTLSTYLNYLEAHLQLPCLVRGIESIGYFGWEERFQFGYGSKAEYERLRREFGSLKDEFELKALEGELEPGWDMMVNVRRTSDGKHFTIPLSELEAVDENSDNAVMLNDYTVWIVNWR